MYSHLHESSIFFSKMLVAFLALTAPHSRKANPHCMTGEKIREHSSGGSTCLRADRHAPSSAHRYTEQVRSDTWGQFRSIINLYLDTLE